MSFTQATPMRPVPGAFMNTPAVASKFSSQSDPVRRRLFTEQTNATAGQVATIGRGLGAHGVDAPVEGRQALSQVPGDANQVAPPPKSPLAKAATYVNDALTRDGVYPDLDTYCKQFSSDYEVFEADSPRAAFETKQLYDVPQRVFEQFERAEVSTMMGLFAELNHAWVCIDNCLYLWDYTHPNPELVGFEDNPHSITAVKLVPPKPGVFVKEINYMLVVATSAEIFLLGVAAQPTPSGAKTVNLYQTKMSLPLRGAGARVIAGSATGRIFFASGHDDISIYELYYQQEEKWFSSRTGKINHSYPGWTNMVSNPWGPKGNEYVMDIVVDDTRNLVYTLSNTSTIRTYHMQAPDKLVKVIERTKVDVLRDILHYLKVPSSLLDDRLVIVSICPITATEDAKVCLMAVTSLGCRLFMSAASASYFITPSPTQAPQSMQLHSIKFPPSDQPETQRRNRDPYGNPGEFVDLHSRQLATIRKAVRFAPGYFLAFKALGPGKDELFASAPDTARIQISPATQNSRYYEHATWFNIQSKAEDVGLITKPFAATQQPLGFGNELAVQFDEPSSEFAILTNTGVQVVRRRRLVDIFAAAVRAAAGEEGLKAEVNKFQNLYGRVETITAALAVACGQGNGQLTASGRSAIDQATEDRARQVFISFGGNPTLPEQDASQGTTADRVIPSSRHQALSLYISRLIRTLWKARVISFGTDVAGAMTITSSIPNTKLNAVQENLERLRKFLDNNKSFIQGLSGPADLQRAANKQEELALQGEHQAMHALQMLMTGISEGISFVLMLFDERVVDIFTRLDETSKQQFRDLTYQSLFTQASGKDLAKLLVKAIVNRNIESGANVETVADALRRRCGSFCSPDDVVIFRAQEQLKRASDPAINANASRTLLGESLKLFQRVAKSLTQPNLQNAVDQYIALRYFAGAIQLCLNVAQEKDRGNAALSWINDGKPEGDPRAQAFEERKQCYNLIHHVLQNLDAASHNEPEMIDGRRTLIATKKEEAYTVVNNSADEVFHLDLYDWYVQQGWTERLLNIESPHVVTFLQRLADTDVQHADLLCRFYTMRSQFFDAARVQYSIAQSDLKIGIKERLQLLSRAKTNISVITAGVPRGQLSMLNHDITELLEVAHIQDDLLERLRADPRIPPERLLQVGEVLDGQVQGLSELFNEYADQAAYYDLCLLIYHAAGYTNHNTVAQTWSSLIEQVHQDAQAQWDEYEAVRSRREVEPPAQPYEKLVGTIQEVCHRTSNDSGIFPVPVLLPEVCRYSVEHGQDGRIGADVNWPVTLFLQLGVSHDLVTRVLEQMFESQEVPFRGAGRARVVEWIVAVLNAWTRELARSGRPDGGLPAWVRELLEECDVWINTARSNNDGGMEMLDLKRELREVKRTVASLIGGGMSFSSSMGFL